MAKSKKVLTKKNKTMRKKMRWGGAVNNMKAAPVAVESKLNNKKPAPVAVESKLNNKKPASVAVESAVNNKAVKNNNPLNKAVSTTGTSVMSFFNKLNPLKKK
jgi:hypothetical protein